VARSRKKRPRAAKAPTEGKKPRLRAEPRFEDRRPSWRLGSADWGGAWGLSRVADPRALLEKLGSAEQMTWEAHGQHGSHNVAVARLAPLARKRLSKLAQNDIDELYSMRLDGKGRLWGIRDREILRILWWDQKHEVCPSRKKHT